MYIEIPVQILESSGAFILFGILTIAFLHGLRKKISHMGISFLFALILSFVSVLGLYKFSLALWYSHFLGALNILLRETSRIYLLIPIVVGLILVFLGDHFSEKMSKQQYRSFYHAVYGLIVVGIAIISPNIAFLFLSISLMLLFMAEYLRLSDDESSVTLYVKKILNKPLRSYEKRGYVASFSYTGAMLLIILFLPKGLALGSGLILSLGDPSAALIGRRFGNHKFRHNPDKSLEGSLAMLVVSFISLSVLSLYFQSISFSMAFFASISAVILESFDLKVSDNFLIPIFAGIVMHSLVV